MENNENEIKSAVSEDQEIKPNAAQRFAGEVFDWIQTFAQALFAVVIIFTFFFRFVTVDGHSMDNTLSNGDRLIISEINYTPERGDIVVIHDMEAEKVEYNPQTDTYERVPAFQGPIIKRVIATEGETVIIDYDNWQITVIDTKGNKHLLEEPYVLFEDVAQREPNKLTYPAAVGNLEEHVVAEGCVFVCGDNRNNSLDSRFVGDIETEKILGKALWRVFPFTKFGSVDNATYRD